MKLTKKEQMLRFVETKGSARHKEIIEFLTDLRFCKGTYASDPSYFRGRGSSGFSNHMGRNYFLQGENRLKKNADGSYSVIRPKKVTLIKKINELLND